MPIKGLIFIFLISVVVSIFHGTDIYDLFKSKSDKNDSDENDKNN